MKFLMRGWVKGFGAGLFSLLFFTQAFAAVSYFDFQKFIEMYVVEDYETAKAIANDIVNNPKQTNVKKTMTDFFDYVNGLYTEKFALEKQIDLLYDGILTWRTPDGTPLEKDVKNALPGLLEEAQRKLNAIKSEIDTLWDQRQALAKALKSESGYGPFLAKKAEQAAEAAKLLKSTKKAAKEVGIFRKYVLQPTGATLKWAKPVARFVPAVDLVYEVQDFDVNKLLTSQHTLETQCINKKVNAPDTAAYILKEFSKRIFVIPSLIPNFADTATGVKMKDTANFLLNAGCFDEYRTFIADNRAIFNEAGSCDDKKYDDGGYCSLLLSPDEISKNVRLQEKQLKRMSTPYTPKEMASHDQAVRDFEKNQLQEKKKAFNACCSLTPLNCPYKIENDLPGFKDPLTVSPAPSITFKDGDVKPVKCSELKKSIDGTLLINYTSAGPSVRVE